MVLNIEPSTLWIIFACWALSKVNLLGVTLALVFIASCIAQVMFRN